MTNKLITNGFVKSENSSEYVKGDWTVRLDESKIEVFNNPDKSAGYYYIGPIDKVDIQTIVDEINEFIMR